MPYVMSGGDSNTPIWVDDVTYQTQYGGRGAVPGTEGSTGTPPSTATTTPTDARTSRNPAATGVDAGGYVTTPGYSWGGTMPGKGQFQDMPYSGPSDWRGIPFYQTDSAGRNLSKYQNAVDQLYASEQPISGQFTGNRFNFGSGAQPGLLNPQQPTGAGAGGGGLLGGGTPPAAPTPPAPTAPSLLPPPPGPNGSFAPQSYQASPIPQSGPQTLKELYALPPDVRTAYIRNNQAGMLALQHSNPNYLGLLNMGPGAPANPNAPGYYTAANPYVTK